MIQTERQQTSSTGMRSHSDFLGKLDLVHQQLNAQRCDLTRAIDSTNELLKIVAARDDTLDRVLTEFPPLIKAFRRSTESVR